MAQVVSRWSASPSRHRPSPRNGRRAPPSLLGCSPLSLRRSPTRRWSSRYRSRLRVPPPQAIMRRARMCRVPRPCRDRLRLAQHWSQSPKSSSKPSPNQQIPAASAAAVDAEPEAGPGPSSAAEVAAAAPVAAPKVEISFEPEQQLPRRRCGDAAREPPCRSPARHDMGGRAAGGGRRRRRPPARPPGARLQ